MKVQVVTKKVRKPVTTNLIPLIKLRTINKTEFLIEVQTVIETNLIAFQTVRILPSTYLMTI